MNLMRLKRVCFAGEVCAGKGATARLASMQEGNAAVLSAQFANQFGLLDRITAELGKAGVNATTLLVDEGEPTRVMVEDTRTHLAAAHPDWIVAVGGGAVLDLAKLAWALYEHPEFELSGRMPVPTLRTKAKLAAIPTTSGSGSEASQAAVLLDEADHRKIPFLSTEWIPDLVILDPEMTASLPAIVTASTGFDALAHAVEAAVSPLSHPLVRALAGSAIQIIFRALPRAVKSPRDMEAREDMLIGAHLAGITQSFASTGLAHALGHAATAHFGVPHARAIAFFLPLTVRLNSSRVPGVYNRVALDAGFKDETTFLEALSMLAEEVEIPKSLAELTGRTLGEADLGTLAATAVQDVCLRTNCCRLAAADVQSFIASV